MFLPHLASFLDFMLVFIVVVFKLEIIISIKVIVRVLVFLVWQFILFASVFSVVTWIVHKCNNLPGVLMYCLLCLIFVFVLTYYFFLISRHNIINVPTLPLLVKLLLKVSWWHVLLRKWLLHVIVHLTKHFVIC